MGGSFGLFMVRRLAALALSVMLAPTVVWVVFNGLRGTGGQPLYDVAWDALPLAVAPVAALTAATMPLLVTNIALMESAFNFPGLNREIRSVYSNADLPLSRRW